MGAEAKWGNLAQTRAESAEGSPEKQVAEGRKIWMRKKGGAAEQDSGGDLQVLGGDVLTLIGSPCGRRSLGDRGVQLNGNGDGCEVIETGEFGMSDHEGRAQRKSD